MFRTVRLSFIRSLFTVHSAMVYVIQVCRQLSSRPRMERSSILVLHGQKPIKLFSETCRVSCQNKFVKYVHLVGFITKKFVTMHGHMKVKKKSASCFECRQTDKRPSILINKHPQSFGKRTHNSAFDVYRKIAK
jgi:hypothetical protein